jgi:hypothetical protein
LEAFVNPITLDIKATLFVRVPQWGRVQIADFMDNLRKDINLRIDEIAAKGTVVFKLKNDKEVWADVNLQVRYTGNITDNEMLFKLPYVSVLFLCK